MSTHSISVKQRGVDTETCTCTLSIFPRLMKGQKINLSAQRARVLLTVACSWHTSRLSVRNEKRNSDRRKKITHTSIPHTWFMDPIRSLEGCKKSLLILSFVTLLVWEKWCMSKWNWQTQRVFPVEQSLSTVFLVMSRTFYGIGTV
jgi:hypothetical protein